MLEKFQLMLDSGDYILKRMFHPELPLSYHVHHQAPNRNIVFRIEKQGNKWKILPTSHMPRYIFNEENALVEAICENEKRMNSEA